jgi:hypothetical protein
VPFVGGFDLARLEQPERILADVGELVGHDRIGAGFVEGELYEPALRWLQVEGLRAALSPVGLQEDRALLGAFPLMSAVARPVALAMIAGNAAILAVSFTQLA